MYQLVAFEGIAAGSYGCQLAVTIPAGYPVTTIPAATPPQLNVTTVLNGDPAAVAYPNGFTWASLAAGGALGPDRRGALFGTVSVGGAGGGTAAVVNSEACAPNLAFLFDIAVWTPETASVEFAQLNSPLAGVYLTANC